ncbi:cell division septation protein DedD [Novosphingobium sp. PhB165]|uniref:SPOR domain-containing protein n=1 Tax=Novosphingobium sp. PhB165 TaxID=2485105 RepID=UPI0010431D24|nr:SPOR domain-containing protein [Novosphingobium sp. PhB165]TCM19867.1 cell division septation protein DedD [Novosphingobium sp. PhB165]
MMGWGDDRDETRANPFGEGERDAGRSTAQGFERPAQLDLGDEDVRLPWLEGEDEEFEPQRGGGTGQTALLVVLALVAIGAIIGGVFWFTRHKSDQPLIASGGVIEAPKQPYKTRPENPGGDVVAGTGDTSFAVAEGQSRAPQIGEGQPDAPAPGFDSAGKPADGQSAAQSAAKPAAGQPSAKAADKPAPAAPAAKPEPTVSGVGVQVGAYANKATAEAGWATLKVQYPGLAGVNHRIVEGQADIGKVYRLQAVPGDLAAAKALCSGMRSAGLSCQVKQ